MPLQINLARGSVDPNVAPVQPSNRQIDPNAYGASLARDLQQAGAELQALGEKQQREREAEQKRMEKFQTAKMYTEESLYAQEDMQKRVESAPLGAAGFTPQVMKDYEDRHKKILDDMRQQGYSQEAIDTMDLNLTGMRQNLQGKAYDFESTSRVAKSKADLDKVGKDLSQIALSNPDEMQNALDMADQTIDDLPGLDAPLRQKLKDEQHNIITQAAGYGLAQREPMTVLNLLTGGKWSSGRGKPLVATDLPPEANALLNVISGTESPGYNVLNGGERFGSFADHPRRVGKGGTATAAGRYQIVKGTWDRVARANGFTNFSPENQDRGAWWLAQQDYHANTGRDLVADIRAGNFAAVRRGLGSTWEGLAHLSDAAFAKRMLGEGGDVNATTSLIDGKTGNPVLDALDATQRRAVLSAAQTNLNQQQANQRAGFDQNLENATQAYLTEGAYDGPTPQREDFYQAYPPIIAEQKYKEFEGAVQTGAFVQDMKTMSDADIMAQLEQMRPKDTASPTYAREVENFNAAQTAAKNTLDQREKDAAGYVVRNYPAAKQAWDAAMSGQGNMANAFSQMQSAYEQLGIRQDLRKAWPDDIAAQQAARYNAMTPEQKIDFVTNLRNTSGQLYPAALHQLAKNGLPAEMYLSALVTLNPASGPVAANAIRGLQAMEADPTRKPNEQYMQQDFVSAIGAAQNYIDPDITAGMYKAAMGLYVANGGPAGQDYDSTIFQKSLEQVLGASILDEGSVPTLLPPGTTEDEFTSFKERVTSDDLMKLSRNHDLPHYATGETVSASDIADEGTFVRIGPSSYIIQMESDGQPLLDGKGQRFVVLLDQNAVRDVGNAPITAGPTGPAPGLLEPGNINLEQRPVVKNTDGSISTVRSMSFNENGKEVLIPMVSPSGQVLTEEGAIALYHRTGQFLGKFDSPEAADAYAQRLHEAQDRYYTQNPSGGGQNLTNPRLPTTGAIRRNLMGQQP